MPAVTFRSRNHLVSRLRPPAQRFEVHSRRLHNPMRSVAQSAGLQLVVRGCNRPRVRCKRHHCKIRKKKCDSFSATTPAVSGSIESAPKSSGGAAPMVTIGCLLRCQPTNVDSLEKYGGNQTRGCCRCCCCCCCCARKVYFDD